jgi:hypothetical protein
MSEQIGHKEQIMGNWYDGDICEIHDTPDECEEENNSCGMRNDANDDNDPNERGCGCSNPYCQV